MDIKNNVTMKELPELRRPYERCKLYGAESLNDAELLAVILRNGTKNKNSEQLAYEVLNHLPGKSISGLLSGELEELTSIEGIGEVKVILLRCIGEIAKRIIKSDIYEKTENFSDSETIAKYYMNTLRQCETEKVILILLNTRNDLIREIELSHGSFNAALITPKEIFYNALKYKAVSIIILHNHPSGNPTPSKDDIDITCAIKKTSRIVGINFLDHIIIGDNKYVSLRNQGYISD